VRSFHAQDNLQTPAREGVEDNMKTALLRSAFLSLAVLGPGISLQAQNDSRFAHLSGTLSDSNGGGITDVQVEARMEGSSNSQTWLATSSPGGEYSLDLPAGRYRVRFTRSAFASREMVLDLAPGESRTLGLRLDLAPLSSNVVVTAYTQPTELAHAPAPVDIVGPQEIEQREAVSLPDLLSTQTGISLARTGPVGGLATIFIDGGDSAFTKVLIDGTPVNLPGGDMNFSNLTLDNVDKVEIVHGAESALYGSDAMSGVVQIISHRGSTRIPELDLFSEGGGFSSARGGGQFSGLLGKFDYSAAGSYFHTDGQGVNDAFLNRGFAGNFGYSFSDSNQLRLTVRSDASFAGTPGQTLLGPAFSDSTAYDDLRQLSGSLNWSLKTGSHWVHRISGMEARFLDTAGFPDFRFFETAQFNRAGILAQSTYSFRSGAITAGFQYEVENADPNNLSGLHARRNNQAGFLDVRWLPVARLTLSAGARVEDNTNFGTRVVPRLGGVYALRYSSGFWSDTRFKVSYGQGIEEPTIFESFSQDPCNPGNPALRPEQSHTLHVGLDQFLSDNRVRLTIGFFDSEFHNLINQLVGPANPMCFGGNEMLYFNTDFARARGFNWSGEAHLLRWLTVNGNYSYDDSRVLQTIPDAPSVEQPGNHLIRRPVNSGNAWLNVNFRRVNFNLAGYFTGVRTDSDFDGLGLTRNPGYARFDMATSYAFGKSLFLYARLSNLFDKRYQDAIGFPALGRDYRLGLKYRIGSRN
jgi:vitamin B12 transporter